VLKVNREWWDRYQLDIPVVHIESTYFFKHRAPFDGDTQQLARAIEKVAQGGAVEKVGFDPDARKARFK
jgi:hypothetical protein